MSDSFQRECAALRDSEDLPTVLFDELPKESQLLLMHLWWMEEIGNGVSKDLRERVNSAINEIGASGASFDEAMQWMRMALHTWLFNRTREQYNISMQMLLPGVEEDPS